MAERNSTDRSHSPYFNSLCKALYFDIDNNVHKCLFGNPKENGKEIETCKDCPNQYSSLTAADIYAIRQHFEDYFDRITRQDFIEAKEKIDKLLRPKIDIEWELDDDEPEPLRMFYKMNPTLYIPGRKPRTRQL